MSCSWAEGEGLSLLVRFKRCEVRGEARLGDRFDMLVLCNRVFPTHYSLRRPANASQSSGSTRIGVVNKKYYCDRGCQSRQVRPYQVPRWTRARAKKDFIWGYQIAIPFVATASQRPSLSYHKVISLAASLFGPLACCLQLRTFSLTKLNIPSSAPSHQCRRHISDDIKELALSMSL